MRRGPAIAIALVTTLGSLAGLLAASGPRPTTMPSLPGAAAFAPRTPAPAPRCLGTTSPTSYATDRLADAHGGVPQRLGLAAVATPLCL